MALGQLLDYDSTRSKARKLATSEDTAKLRMAESEADQAEEVFRVLDAQVRNDIPQLLDLRVPYLDPSFECMVSSEMILRLCFGLWSGVLEGLT